MDPQESCVLLSAGEYIATERQINIHSLDNFWAPRLGVQFKYFSILLLLSTQDPGSSAKDRGLKAIELLHLHFPTASALFWAGGNLWREEDNVAVS